MLEAELVQIVESVWQVTVGNTIRHLPTTQSLADPTAMMVTASIRFAGASPGKLTATCSTRLVGQIAAAMFGLPAEQSSIEDVQDAIGEIVNIVGGNLKAVLPSPCQLSLPAVSLAKGATVEVPSDALWFESEGEELAVQLVFG